MNLIRQYTMISILALTKGLQIFHVLLYDILHLYLIFKDGFEDLTFEQKSMLLIANINTDIS